MNKLTKIINKINKNSAKAIVTSVCTYMWRTMMAP